MWDLLDGPMPAAIPLCCCCAAKAGLDSDICRMSLMMFCLSMGEGNVTGRSSQKSCDWDCRSFKMSSSSEDCKGKKMGKQLGLNCFFTCRHNYSVHVECVIAVREHFLSYMEIMARPCSESDNLWKKMGHLILNLGHTSLWLRFSSVRSDLLETAKPQLRLLHNEQEHNAE